MSIYTLMPLHKCLGLAVIGVDLSAPIDRETSENLSRLLAQNLVLVFPAQTLTPEQYLTAARAFGPPMRHGERQAHMRDFPEIGLDKYQDGPFSADTWHTDQNHRECPPAATILYGVEIPSFGGGTSIANMCEAYWSLPDEERSHLDTLRTVNGPDAEHGDPGLDDVAGVRHPMVRTHPISRERSVYFHPTKTLHIEGMTAEASRAYFADLVERTIQPEIVYHHSWVKGDVVVIDDRATLYRTHHDSDPSERRVLWRVIIEGDRPVLV